MVLVLLRTVVASETVHASSQQFMLKRPDVSKRFLALQ